MPLSICKQQSEQAEQFVAHAGIMAFLHDTSFYVLLMGMIDSRVEGAPSCSCR